MNRSNSLVLCMKWGGCHPAHYVNRLAAGVARNLSRPHRFICFTDDADGLDPTIEIYPLPLFEVPVGTDRGWRKLSLFADRLADLSGTALYLDLDVVITGSLDAFFELPGSFRIARSPHFARAPTDDTSVFRFEIGDHSSLLAFFNANARGLIADYRTERRLLSEYLRQRGLLEFWPTGWCATCKTDCMPIWPLGYFLRPTLPPEARIVTFNDHPRPEEALEGTASAWYRPAKPAAWIKEHWRS